MNIPIEKKWFDVLAYSTSPINNKKSYYIGSPEFLVLQKLIHYDTSDRYITYSNRIIANHIFRKARYVEKPMQALIKKGFITSKTQPIVNGHNNITTKRTITINWGLFESILAEIESTKEHKSQPVEQPVKASETHKDIPTPPVTEDSHQPVKQPVKPMGTGKQVIEPAHKEGKPQLSSSQVNMVNKVIDIVTELMICYHYPNEVLANKLFDDYEDQICKSILNDENFDDAKVRADVTKVIFQEKKKLKVAS
jgi:hypothetical protein